MSLPTYAQVSSLPVYVEQDVTDEFIDENGHMNITDYFRLGTWAPWLHMRDLGMGDDYIARRGMSFFTVEHRISYVGELRLGEPLAVHTGLVARTDRAVHAVAYVVDRARARLACALELMYVHVSMESRRASQIPDDLGTSLDAELATHPWLPDVATGLSVRR